MYMIHFQRILQNIFKHKITQQEMHTISRLQYQYN